MKPLLFPQIIHTAIEVIDWHTLCNDDASFSNYDMDELKASLQNNTDNTDAIPYIKKVLQLKFSDTQITYVEKQIEILQHFINTYDAFFND